MKSKTRQLVVVLCRTFEATEQHLNFASFFFCGTALASRFHAEMVQMVHGSLAMINIILYVYVSMPCHSGGGCLQNSFRVEH